jgi:kinetochore protein NDC80
LFKMIDENFKFGSKSEDDIPVVFKQLRYPFQISKSSLYAVGSAHTWPYLLAALIWLVHMYIYEDDVTKAVRLISHSLSCLRSNFFGRNFTGKRQGTRQ